MSCIQHGVPVWFLMHIAAALQQLPTCSCLCLALGLVATSSSLHITLATSSRSTKLQAGRVSATPRQLEAMIRISEALARMHLRDMVRCVCGGVVWRSGWIWERAMQCNQACWKQPALCVWFACCWLLVLVGAEALLDRPHMVTLMTTLPSHSHTHKITHTK